MWGYRYRGRFEAEGELPAASSPRFQLWVSSAVWSVSAWSATAREGEGLSGGWNLVLEWRSVREWDPEGEPPAAAPPPRGIT